MLLKVAMQHTSAVSDNPLTVVFKLWCLFIKYKFEYNTEQKKKNKGNVGRICCQSIQSYRIKAILDNKNKEPLLNNILFQIVDWIITLALSISLNYPGD